MTDYDGSLRAAKTNMEKTTLAVARKDANVGASEIDQAVSGLNKAWDELTCALIRQRDERDAMIRRLLDELAEGKPR